VIAEDFRSIERPYAILAQSESSEVTPQALEIFAPSFFWAWVICVILCFCSMSKFPPASSAPAPFIKQRAMAASRAAAAEFVKPEDSASWSLLHEQPGQAQVQQPAQGSTQQPAPGKAPPPMLGQSQAAGVGDPQTAQSSSSGTQPPPRGDQPKAAPIAQPVFAGDAPANQAARQVLGSAQQQAKRLAAQKAQAKKKGIRWGQMSGANS